MISILIFKDNIKKFYKTVYKIKKSFPLDTEIRENIFLISYFKKIQKSIVQLRFIFVLLYSKIDL